MPAVPTALAAHSIAPQLAARAVAVKPHAPVSRPPVAEWHPCPPTRWPARRSPLVTTAGRTRISPTDSPRRMSAMQDAPSTAPRPRTHAEATAPTPTRRTGRPPISDIAPGERTPQRQIRISNEDWYGAAAKAAEMGTTSSDVTRRLLRAWRLGEIDLPE